MTNYAGLGFDPTPGEPGDVQNALRAFADTGNKVATMIGTMEQALDVSDGWVGDAADDFHDNGDDLPKALAGGAESMGNASEALVTWFGQLTGNKQQAEALDRLARELKKQLAQAEEAMAAAASGARMARGDAAGAAQRAYEQAAAGVDGLRAQLDAVIDEARQLEQQHLEQAEATAAKLRGAKGDAFEPVGGGAQIVGGVSAVLGEISTWTGRAAFVAALVPGGQAVAGALAITSAATGAAGAGGNIYAHTQGVPGLANRSIVSLAADGLLSVGGPAGKATSQAIKALRHPRRSAATAAVTAAISPRGAASEVARRAGRGAVDGGQLGRAAKTWQDAHGANSVSDALRRVGEIRAREAAETGIGGRIIEDVVGRKVNERVRDRLDRVEP